MVRIAPVRFEFNPKTLWFDANSIELQPGDPVVVSTVRGQEFGHVANPLFDMEYEDVKKLKSALKPVVRRANEDDIEHAKALSDMSVQALPIFKQMARELAPDMNPIAVEYLFDSDKAIFYFDSEERIDFRELVRKLASEFHVRVDMKQIGVRDGARMIGGLGHCGQELCCRRLGGEFNPVSIRMAKEQDLSLNPQKISGCCGRLMCCLRYEFDAYKDFHARAPKKNARIETPDGEGKVVDLDVPREVISIKVGDEKPVRIPLSDMEGEEGQRPSTIGKEAWEKANAPVGLAAIESASLFSTSHLTGEDKLAEPGAIHRAQEGSEQRRLSRSRSRRNRSGSQQATVQQDQRKSRGSQEKGRRRRSTTVRSDGATETRVEQKKRSSNQASQQSNQQKSQQKDRQRDQQARQQRKQKQHQQQHQQSSKQPKQQQQKEQRQKSQVGRNSSGLRNASGNTSGGQETRRRRRSHKTTTEQ